MIINSDKISEISKAGDKYLFIFDNKFVWSIEKNFSGNYFLTIYPKIKDSDEMVDNTDKPIDSITYRSIEYDTQEATESFFELFLLIQEKAMNVDEALDAIIDLSKN